MIKTLITFVLAGLGFIVAMDSAQAATCGAKPAFIPDHLTVECICGPASTGWGPSNPCSWIFVSK